MLAISGCAQVVYQLQSPTGSTTAPFAFQDQRPDWEKKRALGSFVVSACDYAINLYADESTNPQRMDYLKSRLSKELGAKLQGATISVKSFTVYDNGQKRARSSAIDAGIGALGVAVGGLRGVAAAGIAAGVTEAVTSHSISDGSASLPAVVKGGTVTSGGGTISTAGCTPEFVPGGIFPAEDTGDRGYGISNLLVTINGKDFSVRVVEPTQGSGPTLIPRVVTKIVDRLALQLQATL